MPIIRSSFTIAGAVYLLGANAPTDAAHSTARCTTTLSLLFSGKGITTTWAIATAAADTLRAGPGEFRFRTDDARAGSESSLSIYGQVFDVSRISAGKPGLIPKDAKQIVVVPWGSDDVCRIAPWRGFARWVPPGVRGLMIGELREKKHWVNGIPTLDAMMPQYLPYPNVAARVQIDVLSSDEAYSMVEAMPEASRLVKDPQSAVREFQKWIVSHPDLARKSPAGMAIFFARYSAESVLDSRIKVEIAGDYRMVIAMPGRDSVVFFARVGNKVMTSWKNDRPTRPNLENISQANSLALFLYTVATEAELTAPVVNKSMAGQGYMNIERAAAKLAGGGRSWKARVELPIEQTLFGTMTLSSRGSFDTEQGEFVMDKRGRVVLELLLGRTSDGGSVILRGERIRTLRS